MYKKLAAGLLALAVIAGFILLKVNEPLKGILLVSAIQFAGFLVSYPWYWKRRGLTLGQVILQASAVSIATVALFIIVGWITRLLA